MTIFLGLVLCYVACWIPTKNQGVKDLWEIYAEDARPVLPLFLAQDREAYDHGSINPDVGMPFDPPKPKRLRYRCYYFWFFGYTVKLHEFEIDATKPAT